MLEKKLSLKINCVDGVQDGESINFYSNGEIKTKGFWKDGKIDGEWIDYDERGKPLKKWSYKDGLLINKDGQKIEINGDGLLDLNFIETINKVLAGSDCPQNSKKNQDITSRTFTALPNILISTECSNFHPSVKKLEYLRVLNGKYMSPAYLIKLSKEFKTTEINSILNNNISSLVQREGNSIVFSIKSPFWENGRINLIKDDSNNYVFDSIFLFPNRSTEDELAYKTIGKFSEIVRELIAYGASKSEIGMLVSKIKYNKMNDEEIGMLNQIESEYPLYKYLDEAL